MDLQFEPGTGLLAAIVQEAGSGEVLMLAWMNQEAMDRTLASGYVTFYSRSRCALWTKGETSGNRLRVVSLRADCDRDAVLVRAEVEGDGVACHTGQRSCFFREVAP